MLLRGGSGSGAALCVHGTYTRTVHAWGYIDYYQYPKSPKIIVIPHRRERRRQPTCPFIDWHKGQGLGVLRHHGGSAELGWGMVNNNNPYFVTIASHDLAGDVAPCEMFRLSIIGSLFRVLFGSTLQYHHAHLRGRRRSHQKIAPERRLSIHTSPPSIVLYTV